MSVDTNLNRLLLDEMEQLRQEIVTGLQQAGKTATGRTANAIRIAVNGNRAQLEAPSYLLTLETGRAPARSSGDKQQFIENLKAWIVAKGISYKDDNDLQRLAGFFRWYINKLGTKQFRMGERLNIISPAIEKFADKINAKAAELYTIEISNVINSIQ